MAGWTNATDYPVYHDVFYYNPDVRAFVIGLLTGQPPPAEVVITPREFLELTRFLNGEPV